MNKTEQDAYWNAQVSKLKRAGFLKQPVPPHQGYRQKLHSWKGGSVTLNAGLDDANEWVHVDITMTGEFRLSWFGWLERRQHQLRTAVEAELATSGEASDLEWIWDPRDREGESWIILRRHGLDLTDKTSREIGQEWVTRAMGAFWRHLAPLVETL